MANLKANPAAMLQDPAIVNLRCPACRHLGAFGGYSNIHDLCINVPFEGPRGQRGSAVRHLGLRICPNPDCREIVFLSVDDKYNYCIYPPERLNFDAVGIPVKILSSFEEAITNHANRCFRSAAIMVRRTLEEICADRNATGINLKARIKSL